MGYDRNYGREEIHQMLWQSERRLRPSVPVDKAHSGHAISRHTEQREDPFDRRGIKRDSTFASRKDLVLAVEEALHDAIGQAELATLNNHDVKTCSITVDLTATLGKIKANVVENPPLVKIGKKQVPTQGPQNLLEHVMVSSVIVIVDKLASAESWAPLHIQTAYPADFIRK